MSVLTVRRKQCLFILCNNKFSLIIMLAVSHSTYVVRREGAVRCWCVHQVICNGHNKNLFHRTSFPPHPSCFPASSPSSSSPKLPGNPITVKGSCSDSSCMAEERVIKRRRPKEEVKRPGELLPHKHTHQVLGTKDFSQGGSACFAQAWTCSELCVCFITSSQTNDDLSKLPIMILHVYLMKNNKPFTVQ